LKLDGHGWNVELNRERALYPRVAIAISSTEGNAN
jgi:hypothetical protein